MTPPPRRPDRLPSSPDAAGRAIIFLIRMVSFLNGMKPN